MSIIQKNKAEKEKFFKPYAQFEMDLGLMFRTKTYLSTNRDIRHCVGAVIMVNPGSSKPKGELHVVNEAYEDNTLSIVNEIISKAYHLKGIVPKPGDYIKIFNIFNLCEWPMNKAIKQFLKHKDSKFMVHSTKINPTAKWVWIGWGPNRPELEDIKNQIRKSLEGYEKINWNYYHPRYIQIKRKKEFIINKIANFIEIE